MSKKRLKPVPVPKTERIIRSAVRSISAATSAETPEASPASAIAALENALAAVRDLAAQRVRAKLSASRLSGVARELKDLLKVMSVYGV